MKVLVINTGSSSIKYQLYLMPEATVLSGGMVEKIGEQTSALTSTSAGRTRRAEVRAANHADAVRLILETLGDATEGSIRDIGEIAAVGHRVVHGGEEFSGSVVIDKDVIASLEKFADLAPLHNPANLIGIRAIQSALPHAVQAGCFDTAFHMTMPEVAYIYALPYELYEKHHIRRYGFHGTSHCYVARRAAELMGRGRQGINIITAHLGNGCSITAVKNGRSVDTSMGLTPLEGLVMGTRSGDFDPAILFYLADKGYDIGSLKDMCNKQSGLLGISGQSNDMRNVAAAAKEGSARAKLAVDIFCYRVKKYIGMYTAVLGTLDAVVFTGGIGENAVEIRQQICSGLVQIGIETDIARNAAVCGTEGLISSETSRVKVYVIPTDEEAEIARDTYRIASGEGHV